MTDTRKKLGARTGGGKKAPARRRARRSRRGDIEFNHVMIYTANYSRAAAFYRNVLGFEPVEEYPDDYGRFRTPGGRTTFALHALEPGRKMDPRREGLRLYFEVRELDAFCERLATKGVEFDKMPEDMPWGWRHAYLRDPDGHQISLYWAGVKRLRKTTP